MSFGYSKCTLHTNVHMEIINDPSILDNDIKSFQQKNGFFCLSISKLYIPVCNSNHPTKHCSLLLASVVFLNSLLPDVH